MSDFITVPKRVIMVGAEADLANLPDGIPFGTVAVLAGESKKWQLDFDGTWVEMASGGGGGGGGSDIMELVFEYKSGAWSASETYSDVRTALESGETVIARIVNSTASPKINVLATDIVLQHSNILFKSYAEDQYKRYLYTVTFASGSMTYNKDAYDISNAKIIGINVQYDSDTSTYSVSNVEGASEMSQLVYFTPDQGAMVGAYVQTSGNDGSTLVEHYQFVSAKQYDHDYGSGTDNYVQAIFSCAAGKTMEILGVSYDVITSATVTVTNA